MGNIQAAKEDWTGLEFANGWQIIKKLNCAEYRKIYQEQTGDFTKIIKNSHYLCCNKNCGTSTYIERTVIQRAMLSKRDCLTKCKGCNGNQINCHYSIACREKNLTKVPDREDKIKIGSTYGFWKVLSIVDSGLTADHQKRATCKCIRCNTIKKIRCDILFTKQAVCECFKSHSFGEFLIKNFLEKHKVPYQSEVVFDNLVGINGGFLRYDFGIYSLDNKIVALIEFDGEQHYQEAGSYFNKDGVVQIHDDIKNKFAENNNIPLLRIPYYEKDKIENIVNSFLQENIPGIV